MGFDNTSSGKKKKITIIGLSSVLLVALVVAVAIGVNHKNETTSSSGDASSGNNGLATSNKAISAICQPTDYKEACVQSLSGAKNTSDPKELVKYAFQATVKNIKDAISNSSVLEQASKDPRTSQAFETCKELLDISIDDLKRSFDKVETFDVNHMDDYIADLKTWLSGAITYQETCIDGFENTTGDSGEKMKKLLKLSGELSSNGLAMVTELSQILTSLQIPGLSRRLLSEDVQGTYEDLPHPSVDSNKRRLLSEDVQGTYEDLPHPSIDFDQRRLLSEDVQGSSDDLYPSWIDWSKRKLLQANLNAIKPNAVVAQDGSGTHKTIMEALNTAPKKSNITFVILIKAGVYKEYIEIPRNTTNIVFIGEGREKTRITGNKNYIDGINTYKTATVAVNGLGFIARDIGIENSAGPTKHQAVALRSSSDMSVFYRCNFDGYQDTLYAHSYRQYYRDCQISGTIDFVFGDAASVFQNCKLIVRKPLENQACMVTAQGRKDKRSTGAIVLQGCHITAEPAFTATVPPVMSYLGRPWKEFSRTIIMQSTIDGNIAPEGWSPWAGTFGLDTCFYAEYDNKGRGANMNKRVNWIGIKRISPQEAESFTPGQFLLGDEWIKPLGIPYDSGMMKPIVSGL